MAQEHELKFVLSSSAQGLEQGMKAAARALETLGKELGELKKELDKSDAALDGLDASQRETAAAADQATAAIRNQSDAQREAIRSTEQMAREQELQTKEIVAGVAAVGTIIAAYKGLQQAVSVAIDAYVDQRNSLVGLRSIAEGTGNSMASLEADLVKLTKSGLIPMADAATALKNLLSRGYTADQAVEVIERLTDAAAFGRQANLDLGEAVRTASEGIRNENSILVDNAGITKNVAKMWADYADQIGVSVNELTMAQKIQAEYNGIMEESKHQVGDAAKLAEEYSGSQAQLEASLQRVKVAFGEAAAEGSKPYLDIMGDLTSGVADVLEKNKTLTTVVLTAARTFAMTTIAVGGATAAFTAYRTGVLSTIGPVAALKKAVTGLTTMMGPLPLIIAAVVGIGSAIFAGMSASAKQAEEDLQALREEALMMGDAFVQNSAAVAEYEQLSSKGTRATAQETAELEEVSRRLVETYGDRVGYLDDEGKAIITNVENAKEQLATEKRITELRLDSAIADMQTKQADQQAKINRLRLEEQIAIDTAIDKQDELVSAYKEINELRGGIGPVAPFSMDDVRAEVNPDQVAALDALEVAAAEATEKYASALEEMESITAEKMEAIRAKISMNAGEIPETVHQAILDIMQGLEGIEDQEDTYTNFVDRFFEIDTASAQAKVDEAIPELQELKMQLMAGLATSDSDTGDAAYLLDSLLGDLGGDADLAEMYQRGQALAKAIADGTASGSDKQAYDKIQQDFMSMVSELGDKVKAFETHLGIDVSKPLNSLNQLSGAFSKTSDTITKEMAKIRAAEETPLSMAKSISSLSSDMRDLASAADEAQVMQEAIDIISSGAEGTDEYSNALAYLADMYGITEDAVLDQLDVMQADADMKVTLAYLNIQLAITEAQAAVAVVQAMNEMSGGTVENADAMVNALNQVIAKAEELAGTHFELEEDADGKGVTVTMKKLNLPSIFSGSGSASRGGGGGGGGRRPSSGGGSRGGGGGGAARTTYTNEALDNAYEELDRRKRINDLTLAEEVKMLEQIKRLHAKTADEIEEVNTKLYEARREMRKADYDYAVAMDRLTLREQAEALRAERDLYKQGTEAWRDYQKQIHNIEKELRQQNYDLAVYYDQLTLEEQVVQLRQMAAEYRTGTNARIELEKQAYDIEKQLRQQNYEDDVYFGRITLERQREQLKERMRMYKTGTEAYKELQRQVHDVEQQIRDRDIESINRINEGIATALRKRYEVQRDAEQKRINDSIKDWQDWATAQQDAIRDQITALDDLAQAEDREEQERKKRRDIAALEQRILYESDEYNRRKLSEELARKEDDLNKWLRRNEVQDLKKSLNEQSRLVQEKAKEEQDALREKLSKNNDYYTELMESASIAAESQKLIADGAQGEILKLMKAYAPDYDLLGKSFGERFVEGFSGQVKDIQTFMDSLSAPIVNYQHQMATVANAAAIKFWNQRGEAAKPEKATNPGAVQTTVPNIELHFHAPVESPVEIRREIERLADSLSRL